MIQIAAPATNIPTPTGRPVPAAAGAGLLAFLMPGAEAVAAPDVAAPAELLSGERQEDAAPGSDLPPTPGDDLRFLAALLPGMALPVAPDAEPAQAVDVAPVTDKAGPKGARWTLPAISTVVPTTPVLPAAAPSIQPISAETPIPDGTPVPIPVASGPIPAAPGKSQAPATEAVMPGVPRQGETATSAVTMAARAMVTDAIRAGVQIAPVPLPAAPVLPLAPIALPANWQAQAAPVVALSAPVPLAAATPLPVVAASAPVTVPVAEPLPAATPVPDARRPDAPPSPLPPVAPDVAALPPLAAALPAATVPAWKDREPTTVDDTPAGIAAAAAAQPVATVAPASGGERSMLDLTQERWPQAMVAHIERLRDAADASDTRIRLVPDALGAIDIGVRQEGETLHVHFTAAEAQTRTLLQEAQPRLAEAAEQRGLKLGQTSVGQSQTESGAGQRQPQSQHQAAPSPRPASSTRTASARDRDDDARLA